MNIFEMMRNGELNVLTVIIPIQMIIFAFLCYILAKSKNRNASIALLVGLAPILNGFALIYYIGVAKLESEKLTH